MLCVWVCIGRRAGGQALLHLVYNKFLVFLFSPISLLLLARSLVSLRVECAAKENHFESGQVFFIGRRRRNIIRLSLQEFRVLVSGFIDIVIVAVVFSVVVVASFSFTSRTHRKIKLPVNFLGKNSQRSKCKAVSATVRRNVLCTVSERTTKQQTIERRNKWVSEWISITV